MHATHARALKPYCSTHVRTVDQKSHEWRNVFFSCWQHPVAESNCIVSDPTVLSVVGRL
uniref:Uncharacterized protein n=1 Tax=Peronospora matthiolae TaxID=2874970 RepID=A0AAV1VMA8_9STRA